MTTATLLHLHAFGCAARKEPFSLTKLFRVNHPDSSRHTVRHKANKKFKNSAFRGTRRQKPILGDKGLTFPRDGSVVFVRSQPCSLQPTLQHSEATHADLPMLVFVFACLALLGYSRTSPSAASAHSSPCEERGDPLPRAGGNTDNCF